MNEMKAACKSNWSEDDQRRWLKFLSMVRKLNWNVAWYLETQEYKQIGPNSDGLEHKRSPSLYTVVVWEDTPFEFTLWHSLANRFIDKYGVSYVID